MSQAFTPVTSLFFKSCCTMNFKLCHLTVFSAISIAPMASAGQDISARVNSAGTIVIEQPDSLTARLMSEAIPEADPIAVEETNSSTTKKMAGYRVQVFSDNNARTAKAEARSKAHVIADALPQYPTYVTYTTPYWRLKVGDFKTQEEAEVAATLIKRAFPDMSNEIRVVRDRINTK